MKRFIYFINYYVILKIYFIKIRNYFITRFLPNQLFWWSELLWRFAQAIADVFPKNRASKITLLLKIFSWVIWIWRRKASECLWSFFIFIIYTCSLYIYTCIPTFWNGRNGCIVPRKITRQPFTFFPSHSNSNSFKYISFN